MELVEPPPPPPPRNLRRALIRRRRARVSELWLRGYTVEMIADELKEKASTIRSDRKALMRDWQDSSRADVTEHTARIVREIGAQKVEAWHAWQRSLEEQRRTVQKAAPSKGQGGESLMQPFRVEVERKTAVGDPRFLDILGRLSALEARLLRLPVSEAPPAPPVAVDASVRVLVIGDAGLPPDMPWLHHIPAGRAEQGRELIPPDVSDSQTVT